MKKIYYLTVLIILSLSFFLTGCKKKEQNYIKIGLLHSLTGTMAISETPVRDSELLAIKEINEAGGVLGKKIIAVEEDGESDYIFPRTANRIIKAQLAQMNGECVGEAYVPMGSVDFSEVIDDIIREKPDVIINSINGDSNIEFFKQLYEAGISADKIPVMSFSISEEEVSQIGIEYLKNILVSWNYYETTQTDKNKKFVSDYKTEYGNERVTGDPIEAGYIAIYMWAMACEKAGSFDVEEVRIAAKGLSFTAPEGTVTIDGLNQHLYKQVRIGKINEKGLIDEIWATPGSIKPDPYLSTYEWARGLQD
ncbi:MAG: transporter substrate-binding protein [Treponema sp.]|nr:transporter substrate-binding protein [Treponema sp.]